MALLVGGYSHEIMRGNMTQAKGQKRTPQSRAERYRLGKALRSSVSRESHADYDVTDKRDPVAILSQTDAVRIPELLPIRYQRMAVSPFAFLRGAAAVMAADLAQMPQVGATVQACGDCHLMNFGAFETPESVPRWRTRLYPEMTEMIGAKQDPLVALCRT